MTALQLITQWNKQHAPGTHVIVSRAHGKMQTTTRSEAFVTEAGDAVIFVNGIAGFYKLEALTVAEVQPKKRAKA